VRQKYAEVRPMPAGPGHGAEAEWWNGREQACMCNVYNQKKLKNEQFRKVASLRWLAMTRRGANVLREIWSRREQPRQPATRSCACG
jgi:hypothetical protein